MHLRVTLLSVTSSQRDLHPQVCAHAGRTTKKPLASLQEASHQVPTGEHSQSTTQWNCSSSVEPVSAFTEDEPPWITVVTSSK